MLAAKQSKGSQEERRSGSALLLRWSQSRHSSSSTSPHRASTATKLPRCSPFSRSSPFTATQSSSLSTNPATCSTPNSTDWSCWIGDKLSTKDRRKRSGPTWSQSESAFPIKWPSVTFSCSKFLSTKRTTTDTTLRSTTKTTLLNYLLKFKRRWTI